MYYLLSVSHSLNDMQVSLNSIQKFFLWLLGAKTCCTMRLKQSHTYTMIRLYSWLWQRFIAYAFWNANIHAHKCIVQKKFQVHRPEEFSCKLCSRPLAKCGAFGACKLCFKASGKMWGVWSKGGCSPFVKYKAFLRIKMGFKAFPKHRIELRSCWIKLNKQSPKPLQNKLENQKYRSIPGKRNKALSWSCMS